ncbi:MAG: PAS domain S-box protein [Thermoflexales bacterium]|nr:PAS domain S-box protein [Thermoflexales bacterium]
MLARIRRWLALPVLESEEQNRVALLLNTMLLTSLAIVAMFVVSLNILASPRAPRVALGTAAVLLGALFLLRRGQVRAASLLLPTAIFLIVTIYTGLAGQGIRHTAVTAYFVVILLAGLLLGARTTLVFGALSLLASLGLFYAEANALFTAPPRTTTLAHWIMLAAMLSLATVLLSLAMNSLRQALDRARDSEERYRSLVETSPDAITLTDLQGNILICNQQAATLYGLERVEQAVGQNALEFIVPEDRPRAIENMRRTLETGCVKDLTYQYFRVDGSRFTGELSASLIRDAEGRPQAFIGIARDISQWVQAEEMLRQLKEFNEEIIQNMAEGVILQDEQGHFTFVNPAAAALLGYTPEEVLQLDMFSIVPPDQHALVLAIGERLARGQAERYEIDALHRDGRRLSLLVSGRPRMVNGRFAGIMAVMTDITELKQKELMLQRQLNELVVLHAVATAGAEATDEAALIERATQIVGETLYPHNFGVLLLDEGAGVLRFHPSYRGLAEGEIEAIPLGNGITGRVALDGQPRRVADVRGTPEYLGLDPLVRSELCVPLQVGKHLIGVINAESAQLEAFAEADERLLITFARQLATAIEKIRLYAESRQRAEVLVAALARLEELDRLKSEFIQNVSHELRTPMGIIMGYAELLDNCDLGELQPDQRGPVAVIARRARMLKKLVDDLMAIMEAESGRLERKPIDLEDLARAQLADFEAAAAKAQLSLAANLAPGLPQVLGDEAHLRRVLDNLVGNALKFTPAGGSISVSLQSEGTNVVLEVTDTGAGIPHDQLERIFERFYQVDGSMSRRHGGVGLGLSLVKEIVEAHNGQVSVQSALGRGASFRVALPAMSEIATEPQRTQS